MTFYTSTQHYQNSKTSTMKILIAK